jgi:hypothetical protein
MTLFASDLELAYLEATCGRPPGQGVAPGSVLAPWRCPYQAGGEGGTACTARTGRTLGCRTYFCEETARRRGEAVYPEALEAVRAIVRDAGRIWWYGPAREWLATRGGSPG